MSYSFQLPLRNAFCGSLILIGLLLQILRFFGVSISLSAVSYAFWLAVVLLWGELDGRRQLQAGAVAGFGVILLLIAWLGYGAEIAWLKVLDGNSYVVAMLVGVSFISLMGSRPGPAPGRAVTGCRGTAGTWLGVHMLGAVLNLSTVFMVGDRLRGHGELSMPQLLALNRGLSSAALWSPFFASMGVVMTLVPKMQFASVLAIGLPLGMAAGTLSLLDLSRRFDLVNVAGYSLSPKNLMMPVSMACLVLLFHYSITPDLSIVSIITFLLPAAALISNLPRGPRSALHLIRDHVVERLPDMRGEIALFLCAGLLTKGVSTFIASITGDRWSLFEYFGALQAVLSFLSIVASAVLGLHPIIGVSVLASILELEGSRQTLFAYIALASWAVGTSVGPLSGINLSLNGRYGVKGGEMMRQNLSYAGGLSVLVILGILLLDAVL